MILFIFVLKHGESLRPPHELVLFSCGLSISVTDIRCSQMNVECRQRLIQKSLGTSHSPVVRLLKDRIYSLCMTTCLLLPADLARLEMIAVAFVRAEPVRAFMHRWLHQHAFTLCIGESLHDCGFSEDIDSGNARVVYKHFMCMRLMCRFFHQVLCSIPNSVIAGSFPAACYYRRYHSSCWKPNDVDIFIFNETEIASIESMYSSCVLAPFGFDVLRSKWMASFSDRSSSDATSTASSQDTPPVSTSLLEASQVRVYVQEWVTRYERRLVAFLRGFSTDDFERNPHGIVRTMRMAVHHVPDPVQPQSYRVVKSIKLRPDAPSSTSSPALLPVNLILVQRQVPDDVSVKPNAFICAGFDITACCVSLLVKENLDFDFEVFEGADDALQHRHLKLKGNAFATQSHSVQVQMSRIYKYITRGFNWHRSAQS